MCLTCYFIYLQSVPLKAVGALNPDDWSFLFPRRELSRHNRQTSVLSLPKYEMGKELRLTYLNMERQNCLKVVLSVILGGYVIIFSNVIIFGD